MGLYSSFIWLYLIVPWISSWQQIILVSMREYIIWRLALSRGRGYSFFPCLRYSQPVVGSINHHAEIKCTCAMFDHEETLLTANSGNDFIRQFFGHCAQDLTMPALYKPNFWSLLCLYRYISCLYTYLYSSCTCTVSYYLHIVLSIGLMYCRRNSNRHGTVHWLGKERSWSFDGWSWGE